jgi:hypothetical protein
MSDPVHGPGAAPKRLVWRYWPIALLIVTALLVTLGLGVLERRTTPSSAQSPVSPLGGPGGRPPANPLWRWLTARLAAAARALQSGAIWGWTLLWILLGLALFGTVAWILVRQFQRIEHRL